MSPWTCKKKCSGTARVPEDVRDAAGSDELEVDDAGADVVDVWEVVEVMVLVEVDVEVEVECEVEVRVKVEVMVRVDEMVEG